MKKKLLATLIATAVLSTGIIGLTACGGNNNGDNNGDEDKITDTVVKGVQVDAEGWAKAFENTFAAESYTAKAHFESSYGVKGTYEELGEIDFSVTGTQEGTIYYDGNEYNKSICKVVATGVPDDETMQNRYKNKEYEREDYIVKDGETYYRAYYSTEEEDAEWTVSTSSTDRGSVVIEILGTSFATEKNGESKTVAELYESFTYKDGVYTAALWGDDIEATVSASVKDGYIAGYSLEFIYEEEDEGGKMSEGIKYVFSLSDYGKTTVTPSDAAKKAVEDYIAAHASVVAGKTYVYGGISFEYDDSVSDATKEQMEKVVKPQIEAVYADITIVFDNNKGFTMSTVTGTYTEQDNVLTLTPSTGGEPLSITLSDDNTLLIVDANDGVTMKMTYVEQA